MNTGGGLRILCLDGGGTRGLSTIYLLRDIMDRVTPISGKGGSIRPSEYFDMIGASGPNGLLALLFTKFSFTIDEALGFFLDFSRRLDAAETILENRSGEELDDEDFDEDPDPDVVIQTVRRQVVCNTFRDVVLERVTDWLERSEHKDGDEFSYKHPLAELGVGRCRAAVMGSESPGHGPNKGVVQRRVYHAPLWHRSYTGRHTRPTYTWWAIGLGTMGSPGIVSNGVIFPDFWATGAHSDHNLVQLLLQECNRIWPGLKVKIIISIGTGNLRLPDLWNLSEHPHSLVAAEACLKICEENQKKAKDIAKYVLPHDEAFRSAYYRFDVPSELPFFEFEAKDIILARSVEYMQTLEIASNVATAALMVQTVKFPDNWEDLVVFSALASLASTFLGEGYLEAAELVSDSISSYILYEGAKSSSDTRRKLSMVAEATRMGLDSANPFSISVFLTALVAFDRSHGLVENLDEGKGLPVLIQNQDVAAACHYFLVFGQNAKNFQQPIFVSIQQSLASEMGVPSKVTQSFKLGVGSLLRMSSFATLCELAYKETLSDQPRLILNPNFLCHFNLTLHRQDLSKFSNRVLDPIATVIRLCCILRPNESWALVNLAVERIQFSFSQLASENETETLRLCYCLTAQQKPLFQQSSLVKILLAKKRYLGLLRKVLEGDQELDAFPRAYSAAPRVSASHAVNSFVDADVNNMLHSTARNGFLMAHKMILEPLGTVNGKQPLAALNNEGLAPIHIACKNRGHGNILLLCLYGGGDINQRDAFGRTAFHHCFPEKHTINEYLPAFEEFVQKHGLLLTLPVNAGCIWGTMYNPGKKVGNRTCMMRTLIRRLFCRGGSINVQDKEGSTPAHLAAKNGWGINCDLFFIGVGAKVEAETHECLSLRDKNGNSVLALMRMNGDAEGERIISSEMRKRMIDISIERNPQTEPYPPPQNMIYSALGGKISHRPNSSNASNNMPQVDSKPLQYHPPSELRQCTTPSQSPSQHRVLSTGHPSSPLSPTLSPSNSPTFRLSPTHIPYSPTQYHPSFQHNQTPPSPALISHPPSPYQLPSRPSNYDPRIYRSPVNYGQSQQQGRSSSMNLKIYRPPMNQQQAQHPPQQQPEPPTDRKETMGNKFFYKLKKRL